MPQSVVLGFGAKLDQKWTTRFPKIRCRRIPEISSLHGERARIDDKGRLKLSAGYLHYFEALPEQDVFVTSLDRSIAEIFPVAKWRLMEAFFEPNEADPEIYLAVRKNAASGWEPLSQSGWAGAGQRSCGIAPGAESGWAGIAHSALPTQPNPAGAEGGFRCDRRDG